MCPCHAGCWHRERTSYHGANECFRPPRGAVRGLGEAFSQPQAPEEPNSQGALVLGELLLTAAQGPEVPSPPPGPPARLPWEPGRRSAQGHSKEPVWPLQPLCTPGSGLAVFSTVLTTELGETVATVRGCRGREGGGSNPWVAEAVGDSGSDRARKVWESMAPEAQDGRVLRAGVRETQAAGSAEACPPGRLRGGGNSIPAAGLDRGWGEAVPGRA